VLGADATSVTITSDGDRDVLYYISASIVNGYAGSVEYYLRPNNVSTNTVYGYQYFQGGNVTVNADNVTTGISGIDISGNINGSQAQTDIFLFAKSGFVRPLLVSRADRISTTTVTGTIQMGEVWNNTADNITSLVFFADQTNGFKAGSTIEVYALRPNG
jgi:hypothetical protein